MEVMKKPEVEKLEKLHKQELKEMAEVYQEKIDLVEEKPKINPYPECPECGYMNVISSSTYRNFEGEIRCYNCGAVLYIEMEDGELRKLRRT